MRKSKVVPKIWDSVATREWSSLTEDNFKTEFFYPQRPLKLVGNFTANMGIWNYLERDIFMSRYGSLRLNVSNIYGVCEEFDKELCFVTVEEYLNNSRYQMNVDTSSDPCVPISISNASNPLCDVVETHSLVGLLAVRGKNNIMTNDVLLPSKFFSVCGLPSPLDGSMHLRLMSSHIRKYFDLGGKDNESTMRESRNGTPNSHIANMTQIFSWRKTNTVTPSRSESALWNVLLVGPVRHWYLISPGAALNISSNSEGRFPLKTDFENWVQVIFPELRKRRLATEVVQRTGDVVFIPYSWSFVTSGQGEMIDFTHRFCVLPENPSVFGQIPTGIRMYGHVTVG